MSRFDVPKVEDVSRGQVVVGNDEIAMSDHEGSQHVDVDPMISIGRIPFVVGKKNVLDDRAFGSVDAIHVNQLLVQGAEIFLERPAGCVENWINKTATFQNGLYCSDSKARDPVPDVDDAVEANVNVIFVERHKVAE